MSETHTTTPVFPPGRYGRRRETGRKRVLPIAALVVVIALSLVVTYQLYQRYGQTNYQPQIIGWEEPSGTELRIKFSVRVPAGGAAKCLLRARDYEGNQVGTRTVVVRAEPGQSSIEAQEPVTTTERASVGDVLSCQPAD